MLLTEELIVREELEAEAAIEEEDLTTLVTELDIELLAMVFNTEDPLLLETVEDEGLKVTVLIDR